MNNSLIGQMSTLYQLYNQEYPMNRERDFPALRSIAEFLNDMGKFQGYAVENVPQIIEVWTQVSIWVSSDKFWKQKSLKTISNHIQEIVQKIKDGDKSKPGGSIKDASLIDAIMQRNRQR